jgi:hypothetical protein
MIPQPPVYGYGYIAKRSLGERVNWDKHKYFLRDMILPTLFLIWMLKEAV